MPPITTLDIERLSQAFETESPEAMLRWAYATFDRRATMSTALGPSGIVLLHMVSQIDPGADIFFLDTGLHFQETYDLITTIEARLGLHIRRIVPARTVRGQAAAFGPSLWLRDPDLCCHMRKVEPMAHHLAAFDLWITGIRRDQSTTRRSTPILSANERFGLLKLNPLATWDEARIWGYIARHDLPTNALHEQNYPSVGCWPCTRAVAPGEDARSGRWAGLQKTECGLHLAGAPVAA